MRKHSLSDEGIEAAKAALTEALPSAGPDRAAFAPDINSAAFACVEAYLKAAPTQPQLSDEDRERLEEAIRRVDVAAHREQQPEVKALLEGDADLLRKLASQQPCETCGDEKEIGKEIGSRGERWEPCPDCQPQQHGEVEEDAERCSTCGKVGGGGAVPAPDSERCPTASMVPCPTCGEGEGI